MIVFAQNISHISYRQKIPDIYTWNLEIIRSQCMMRRIQLLFMFFRLSCLVAIYIYKPTYSGCCGRLNLYFLFGFSWAFFASAATCYKVTSVVLGTNLSEKRTFSYNFTVLYYVRTQFPTQHNYIKIWLSILFLIIDTT